MAAKALLGLVLLFASPSLIGTHPVLLEALKGSTIDLITAGAFARVGQASPVLVFLAPLPTLFWLTPLYWLAGRLWGDKAMSMIRAGRERQPGGDRQIQMSLNYLERFGGLAVALAPWIPIPALFIYAGAGWRKMSFRTFVFFDLLGLASWIGVLVGLGYGIGHPAVKVAKEISHYSLEVTIVLVVVVIGYSVFRAKRAAAAVTAKASDQEE